MPGLNRGKRLLLLAIIALVAAALLWLLIGILRGGVALWQQVRDLPAGAQYVVAAILVAALLALAVSAWRLLRPRPRKAIVAEVPKRADVQSRVDTLTQRSSDAASLQAELAELDRRAKTNSIYIAVFGEISAGKSSLIEALAPGSDARADVLGGTTRAVMHYPARIGEAIVTYADVPGTHEVDGIQREQIARDEALRAHIVLYVCAGDLTRDQDVELRWLRGFGKPLVLVLNKADRLSTGERAQLEHALDERYSDLVDARALVSAGGSETVERVLADGRVEPDTRNREPDVNSLADLLRRYASEGAAAFEHAREAAVLSSIHTRADVLAAELRGRESNDIVEKYTKRAVIGAMAAVMPGSDLIIQAVLAAALIRELSKLYEVPVRDVDIDEFVGQARLTVRTSASLVLAIAGNAAKAFPGLGTLGGGLLHAIAYGLVFDSLGRAVATTLRDHHALDQRAAHVALNKLLADSSMQRLRRIADLAFDTQKDDAAQ
ncbi:MAG: GTPase [Rudaea sp.]